jgi:D-cysteine desulfhydrase
MEYPERLKLAQLPTPLQPLRRLQQKTGGPLIWLKRDDLTGATLTGNKVRKLEFIVAAALANGYGALITCGGIQSNHCRATALVAAQLGLQCHLILRGEHDDSNPDEGNLFLDQLSNASIGYHPAKEYFKNIEQLFEIKVKEYAEKGIKALAIPTGGSDGVGVWGYIAASQELQQNFAEHDIRPAAIICATGSGGTQAGLTVGAKLFKLDAAVFGINVCDDEAWFVRKVSNDISQWQTLYPDAARLLGNNKPDIRVIDGYVGEGYGKASKEVLSTIRTLATLEGVVFDPVYSGKAFHGLLSEINSGRFSDSRDICFIHTGGIFGLFPFASQF